MPRHRAVPRTKPRLKLGRKMEFDVGLMIPDEQLSIDEGAVVAMGWQSVTDEGSFTRAIMKALAEE